MKNDIIRKLEVELSGGIRTEPQVVYLMAGLRKLLEQRQEKRHYEYLAFHADWVLHRSYKDLQPKGFCNNSISPMSI